MTTAGGLSFELDGVQVEVEAEGLSLLEVLRDRLGNHTVKDGCSPQGSAGAAPSGSMVNRGSRVSRPLLA